MVSTFRSRVGVCALIAGVLTALPLALAFSGGADALHTAGSLSNGGGCNSVGCHPYGSGSGSVELIGAPRRYRSGQAYDLTVRISDVDRVGAGFEISVEQIGSSVGSLQVIDPVHTRFADGGFDFITHTSSGVSDSLAKWASGGGSYEYFVGWDAPVSDVGPLHFFVSGQATDDMLAFVGENYYWTFATAQYAIPGDADGDTDIDLWDFATVQRCFDPSGLPLPTGCDFVDMDNDGEIAGSDVDPWTMVMDGPTATDPAGFVLASAVRGGRLYDQWWSEAGLPEPVGDHPLYPAVGAQSGSTTFRCKECHGWDYKGVDGVYGSGSHFTGIAGILGSTMSSKRMFSLLKADPGTVAHGHNMDSYGLSDRDLWDLVRFVKDGVVNTDDFIDASGMFPDTSGIGSAGYSLTCINCHGPDGRDINFGTAMSPEYVGTVAVDNPWEFLHKMRFGHAGTPMPAIDLVGWTDAQMIAVGAFSATLPVD